MISKFNIKIISIEFNVLNVYIYPDIKQHCHVRDQTNS